MSSTKSEETFMQPRSLKPSPLVGEGWVGGKKQPEEDQKKILLFARNMRQSMTDAEQCLWHHLRGGQLSGYSFRRQQPIRHYIVDFVCFDKKLIIEADGGQHAENPDDEVRTAFFKITRFSSAAFLEQRNFE